MREMWPRRWVGVMVWGWVMGAVVWCCTGAFAQPAGTQPVREPGLIDVVLGNDLIALFAVIGVGLAIGQITVAGVSLGSSGVLFAALLLGHLGYDLPAGVGTVGLVLFVYCVGLTAGPSFFRAFVRQGKTMATLGVVIVGLGCVVTWATATIAGIPTDLAAGIFAGSLTSTPALAAATEAVGGVGEADRVSVGYGIAYPYGVIGVVLFVQLLPRVLKKDMATLEAEIPVPADAAGGAIERALVTVSNPAVFGKHPGEVAGLEAMAVQVPRRREGDRLVPIDAEFVFAEGVDVLVVGRSGDVAAAVDVLGVRSDAKGFIDTDRERRQIAVSSGGLIGRTLGEVDTLGSYGVVVSRMTRMGLDIVPRPGTALQMGDLLTVVGNPEQLEGFAKIAGDRAKLLDESHLISLGFGITLGVLLGITPIGLPGGAAGGFALGLAGGPLLVALVMGHFGRMGPLVGYLPRPARLVLMELGLVLFLASAGVKAGGSMVEVIQVYGVALLVSGLVIATVPMLLGFWVARKWLKLSVLETLGGVCGGMTSTPGLGAVTAKTDAEGPVVAYATAYPVALILMTVFAKGLVGVLG
ncbi:MAG: TrkA C-terminal domain-containing protein [Planctomycetota bacterium]